MCFSTPKLPPPPPPPQRPKQAPMVAGAVSDTAQARKAMAAAGVATSARGVEEEAPRKKRTLLGG